MTRPLKIVSNYNRSSLCRTMYRFMWCFSVDNICLQFCCVILLLLLIKRGILLLRFLNVAHIIIFVLCIIKLLLSTCTLYHPHDLFCYLFKAFTKFIRLNSTEYEVKLVDTAGQDEFSIFPLQYSMDFHGYVLVYSINSSKSFQIVQVIYDKLLDMVGKIQ